MVSLFPPSSSTTTTTATIPSTTSTTLTDRISRAPSPTPESHTRTQLNADAVSDREGRPRQRLADFAVDWHMTRFGLRNLAELHLLDLIASVRQHYRGAVRVRWFGQFTGEIWGFKLLVRTCGRGGVGDKV
jgi:hypothetical protein